MIRETRIRRGHKCIKHKNEIRWPFKKAKNKRYLWNINIRMKQFDVVKDTFALKVNWMCCDSF